MHIKNLTPWRDLNPGCTIMLADVMTTMPRRQGPPRHVQQRPICRLLIKELKKYNQITSSLEKRYNLFL
jgi:hypothetical protein